MFTTIGQFFRRCVADRRWKHQNSSRLSTTARQLQRQIDCYKQDARQMDQFSQAVQANPIDRISRFEADTPNGITLYWCFSPLDDTVICPDSSTLLSAEEVTFTSFRFLAWIDVYRMAQWLQKRTVSDKTSFPRSERLDRVVFASVISSAR